jgi:hypothetical protein
MTFVIPAEAGIQAWVFWIPVFTGMTGLRMTVTEAGSGNAGSS